MIVVLYFLSTSDDKKIESDSIYYINTDIIRGMESIVCDIMSLLGVDNMPSLVLVNKAVSYTCLQIYHNFAGRVRGDISDPIIFPKSYKPRVAVDCYILEWSNINTSEGMDVVLTFSFPTKKYEIKCVRDAGRPLRFRDPDIMCQDVYNFISCLRIVRMMKPSSAKLFSGMLSSAHDALPVMLELERVTRINILNDERDILLSTEWIIANHPMDTETHKAYRKRYFDDTKLHICEKIFNPIVMKETGSRLYQFTDGKTVWSSLQPW